MQNKRIRWAASVYARHLPELREVAEPILRAVVGDGVELRWMQGADWGRGKVETAQLNRDEVEEWSDGS